MRILATQLFQMDTQLGIGSRVDHQHFGKGVIVDVASEFYIIWFKSQQDTKSISKDYEGLNEERTAAQLVLVERQQRWEADKAEKIALICSKPRSTRRTRGSSARRR